MTARHTLPDEPDWGALSKRADAIEAAVAGLVRQLKPQPLACSFCLKTEHEVSKLIAGPSVHICDECISLCNAILAEESAPCTTRARSGVVVCGGTP